MMPIVRLSALLLLSLPHHGLQEQPRASTGLEIRVVPDEYLIANKAKEVGLGYQGTSPYYDLVVQAIAVVNTGTEHVRLEHGWIELRREGAPLVRLTISLDEVARCSQQVHALQQAGVQMALDVHYWGDVLFAGGVKASPRPALAPGTAAVVDDSYLVVRTLPDTLVIHFEGRDAEELPVFVEANIPVRESPQRNEYVFPVEAGHWFVQAFPGVKGHHRWTAATEHALDIMLVDERGSWATGEVDDWHLGKARKWTDWYGYGKKVLAAADGEVVKVAADDTFPLEVWGRKENESLSTYRSRIGALQNQRFMAPGADSMAVAAGNHIVIEHAGGEFSMYGHLAYGTILVEEGDVVRQGQHIAGLGGTGEQPVVHLHFQVTDSLTGPLSRTIPVTFRNAVLNAPLTGGNDPMAALQPGYFVTVD